MTTMGLDPNRYLTDHLHHDAVQHGHERSAKVGHVHLCVGDIDSARRFYVDQLGFETTHEFGHQALFVSARGYHHHMAMNTRDDGRTVTFDDPWLNRIEASVKA